MSPEELPDPLPAVLGSLGPVARAIRREKGVTGPLVGVELKGLAGLFQGFLQLGNVLG